MIKYHLNFDKDIYFSLAEIKRNNTLYILSGNNKKHTDYAYGEENLTSILASNLRCINQQNNKICVHCESLVGNGRSDVTVTYNNKAVAIIESKLIKERSDIKKETLNGLDQLYARYSENDTLTDHLHVGLYLVLFCHDKEFRTVAGKVEQAIMTYSKRNNLSYEKIDQTESGVHFLYRERRGEGFFSDKIRVIKVIVCNLEIDYKKRSMERTRAKKFNL